MKKLQNLPIGIQNFEKLRKGDFLYVDKTALMYELVTTGSYYFLSRPRRFGKSLLISTLHAYFDGKKELFDGLAVSKLEQKWDKYPVLHLDLNTQKYNTPDALDNVLETTMSYWESLYGKNEVEKGFALRFEGVIRRAYEKTGMRVAILVDEYDKPLLQAINNDELQDAYRSTLKAFYGALKSMDGCIQFAILTGVTKFGHVSVFSDLNSLKDISMHDRYYDICGISETELTEYFTPYIEELAKAQKLSVKETLSILKDRYDGYHFTETSDGVYNPFSLLNTFDMKKFGSFWFQTGTPTYLVELLKSHNYSLEKMAEVATTEDVLNSIDISSKNPIPVIYQSGYLTIKGYDKEFRMYQLGFPNKEVEEGFLQFLMPFYTSFNETDSPFQIQRFVSEVRSGLTEDFLNRLKSFFADTPYELVRDLENHYQNVLFILYKLLGFYVKAAYHTSSGRIDMVLQTVDYTYVMEFKLDGTAEEALAQINSKEYALPFGSDKKRKLIKIGLNFNNEIRNIEKWIVE